MKKPVLGIIALSIALIFTGGDLQNWIPLSLDWKHDVGAIGFYFGLTVLAKILIKPVIDNIKK